MNTNTEVSVQVSKEFPVSLETLFNAWVSPEELKKWWKPMGFTLQEVTNELKPGGNILYKASDDKGEESVLISGQYDEVKQKELLSYSWNWDVKQSPNENSEFKLTVRFTDINGKSKIEVQQENLKEDESLQVHQKGWENALESLHQHLSE